MEWKKNESRLKWPEAIESLLRKPDYMQEKSKEKKKDRKWTKNEGSSAVYHVDVTSA